MGGVRRRQAAHPGDPEHTRRRVLAPARGPRGLEVEQFAVGHGEIGVAHDGIGRDVPIAVHHDAGDAAVGGARDRRDGSVEPDVDAGLR